MKTFDLLLLLVTKISCNFIQVSFAEEVEHHKQLTQCRKSLFLGQLVLVEILFQSKF